MRLHQINIKNAMIALLLMLVAATATQGQTSNERAEYTQIKKELARGWNTWNTRNVLSHVLLPEGFALNLGFKQTHKNMEKYLGEALIGRREPGAEVVRPGAHSYDGSYTALEIQWQQLNARVESATDGNELVLLVTPLQTPEMPVNLVVQTAMLWNRPGDLRKAGDVLSAQLAGRTIQVYATVPSGTDYNLPAVTPHLVLNLNQPVGISTGKKRSLDEIQQLIAKQKTAYAQKAAQYGKQADSYTAIQSCMAWNTIYEPLGDRVISTVNRIWNVNRGGYVVFCWDNFFGGMLTAVDNKNLAFANIIETLHEKTEDGFISNNSQGNGRKAWDRSQPPVGSMMAWEVYQRYPERWFLETVFDDLLTWNRWWMKNRAYKGLLCWGSDPAKNPWKDQSYYNIQAAMLESGIDDSPMYEGVPFNKEKHVMEMHDVGLNSLYIADCEALAAMASVLNRKTEAAELRARAAQYRKAMQSLWNEKTGLYLNRRTDNGAFSYRLSPSNFYPLLAKVPTQKQAERMIQAHFYNPQEFWGDWIMPSIARNDSAFQTQNYWKGSIWAPMNFLVYLGMRNYKLPQAKQDLAHKSETLFLNEWRRKGYVSENYSAITGKGDDPKINSENYYFWGGLLGLIGMMEEGYSKAGEGNK